MVSASCYANGIVNSTIAFIRSSWLKQGTTWHFGHLTLLVLVSVSHDANDIMSSTLQFIGSWWSKWGATWLLRPCDAIFARIWHYVMVMALSIAPLHIARSTQSKWGARWLFGHVMLLAPVLASCDADSIIKGTIAFVRSTWCSWQCDAVGTSISVTRCWFHH